MLLMVHVFVLFMLFVLVPPSPVLFLLSAAETVVFDVRAMALLQPTAVDLILAIVPIVVVPAIRVVYPTFALFPFMAFVISIILCECLHAQRGHECCR